MKICIFVSSQKQLHSAGTRIRYQRLMQPLSKQGWELVVFGIDDLAEFEFSEFSFVVFSKCQDIRSILLAKEAKRHGLSVGVDLFDDYFSQETDARFNLQRQWLHNISKFVDFFLCSTKTMMAVASAYAPNKPAHLISDPSEEISVHELASGLAGKSLKIVRERKVSVLWFGIASNPNFAVGVHDLVAFSYALTPFLERGFDLNLTILTNLSGITADMHEKIRKLPVQFQLRDWTKEREEEALSKNFISFIPVNHQAFSMAKSLNRAITALTGGTQVLTTGYPLYHELDEFIYTSANDVLDDLENDSMRLSAATAPKFVDWIGHYASSEREAGALISFLTRVSSATKPYPVFNDSAVLHLGAPTKGIAKVTKDLGVLCLAPPFIELGLIACDAHMCVSASGEQLQTYLTDRAFERLSPRARELVVHAEDGLIAQFQWKLPEDALAEIAPIQFDVISRCGRSNLAGILPIIAEQYVIIFQIMFDGIEVYQSVINALDAAFLGQGSQKISARTARTENSLLIGSE